MKRWLIILFLVLFTPPTLLFIQYKNVQKYEFLASNFKEDKTLGNPDDAGRNFHSSKFNNKSDFNRFLNDNGCTNFSTYGFKGYSYIKKSWPFTNYAKLNIWEHEGKLYVHARPTISYYPFVD